MIKRILNAIRYKTPYIEKTVCVEHPDQFHFDYTTDLVVAGFGGAGAATAIEADNQGLETLIIERFNGGGATAISGGIYYAGGGTRIQKVLGFEDSSENMYAYLKHEVQEAVAPETLRNFCDQSVDNFDFLEENGVPFDASYCPFKTSYPPDHYFFYYSGNEAFPPYNQTATAVPRGHRGHKKGISGKAIFEPLKNSVKKRKIPVLTQTKLVSLIQNSKGEVIGLKAIRLKQARWAKLLHQLVNQLQIICRYLALFWPPLFNLFAILAEKLETTYGESLYIRARKGVVLATGGFYANQQMIKEYANDYSGGSPLGTLTDDGSGIQLAMQIGAQVKFMDKVSAWRFINPPTAFSTGMLVGPSGQRICNEMLYGAQVGDKMMKEHNGKAYVIIDHSTYKQAYKDLSLKKGLWFHLLLGAFYLWFDRKKAFSIPELAKKLNINESALTSSVTQYNAIAESTQEDPLGKPKSHCKPIKQGPFYAINASYDYFFVPCPSLTLGGLAINEQSSEVLNQSGQPFSGLYAVGRTAVGIASQGYVSGLSIADCIFSGRRAAKHAAKNNSLNKQKKKVAV